ncbi:hypothetical protein BJX64DRAFT_271163 [Aspergillus heterothallicus]
MSLSNTTSLLPLEILQAILIFLDFDSFYLASLTCRIWRNAALAPAILRRQLLTVPALSESADLLRSSTLHELSNIYRRVCRDNLIWIRSGIQVTQKIHVADQAKRIGSVPVRSRHGSLQSAQLRGLTLTLDSSPGVTAIKTREIQLSPTLYPSAETVRQTTNHARTRSFFGARSFARMQVAVSACGGLVTVGLGQKLHIYAVQVQSGKQQQQQNIELEVTDSALDSIQGVEFTDNDELIRIEVDGVDGRRVRYLGHRRCRCYQPMKVREPRPVITAGQRLRYWLVASRNVYLDSTHIESRIGGGVSLRGLQVMNISHRGGDEVACTCWTEKYFFALLRDGSCEGRYVTGHISSEGNVDFIQAMPTRRISTFPEIVHDAAGLHSSCMRLDRWDTRNLPLANSPDPLLSVSGDGNILAVCEPPQGQSQGTIYICSADASFRSCDRFKGSVAWPFALAGVDHELDSLTISKDEDTGGYTVAAQCQEQLLHWRLHRLVS